MDTAVRIASKAIGRNPLLIASPCAVWELAYSGKNGYGISGGQDADWDISSVIAAENGAATREEGFSLVARESSPAAVARKSPYTATGHVGSSDFSSYKGILPPSSTFANIRSGNRGGAVLHTAHSKAVSSGVFAYTTVEVSSAMRLLQTPFCSIRKPFRHSPKGSQNSPLYMLFWHLSEAAPEAGCGRREKWVYTQRSAGIYPKSRRYIPREPPVYTQSPFQWYGCLGKKEYLSSKRSLLYVPITRARGLAFMVSYGEPCGLIANLIE